MALFLYFSDGLIRDLSAIERERMQLWADATKEIVSTTISADDALPATDIDFLLKLQLKN